mgnify:CR=1 FL=1
MIGYLIIFIFRYGQVCNLNNVDLHVFYKGIFFREKFIIMRVRSIETKVEPFPAAFNV